MIQKLINSYDAQGNIVSCETYDSEGNFAFREQKTYNHLGLVLTEKDRTGKEILYAYDLCGNRTGMYQPEKTTLFYYDLRDQLTHVDEVAAGLQLSSFNKYDLLGKKNLFYRFL